MRIIIFDTETTGTPKDYKAPMNKLDNWPRVIQLAWQVYDTENKTVTSEKESLIVPDGWVIPVEKFWIDNGFNTDKNKSEGLAMPTVLRMFLDDYNTCDYMAAPNIGFDYPVLGAEMIRYNVKATKKLIQLCTMATTVDLCQIPFPNGGRYFKFPKLLELHQYLFKKGFDGAHDAGSDVAACRVCLIELIDRGVIKLSAIA